MKTMFEPSGFRGANVFSEQGRPKLGASLRMRGLGDPVSQLDRDGLLSVIKSGTARMAAVRSWIASRIGSDPLLAKTFNDPVVQSNFWSFDDLVNTDQWAVDAASLNLNSSDPSTWDLSPEIVQRVGDWGKAVDTMYAGMQEYGGGIPMPIKLGPTGPTVATAPSGGAAAALRYPPAPVAGGLTTGQMVVGGAVILAAGLFIAKLF